jgi:dTDP-4-amino-4,6-dideoxygalactose transaminase
MSLDQLAIFGGVKSINYDGPHWLWPPISEERIEAAASYLRDGKKNQSGYPEIVEEFEQNFASYHGSKYALTMNSGTSSLHAAFFAIGAGSGDEIIAPSLTFHATASPIVQTNAVPILCDCEPDTGNIDPVDLETKITKRTVGVVITHICGHPCEMDAIKKITKKYGIALIEDCSHAHGAEYKGHKVGTFGDIGIFSLDNNKILASGEGGVIITNDRKYYERAMIVSDFGPRTESEITLSGLREFNTTGLGLKHRIHPVSAAIANYELTKLDEYIEKRLQILTHISGSLCGLPGVSPPVTRNHVTRGAFFGYRPFYIKGDVHNLDILTTIKILQSEGMEIRQSSNPPLHLMALFQRSKNNPYDKGFVKTTSKFNSNLRYEIGDFPVSEEFYNSTFSIPTFTLEPDELIKSYIIAFKKVFSILSTASNSELRIELVKKGL